MVSIDTDRDFHQEGPTLCHFRSHTIDFIEKRSSENWTQIMQQNIELPTSILRIFDENGNLVSCTHNNLEENNDGGSSGFTDMDTSHYSSENNHQLMQTSFSPIQQISQTQTSLTPTLIASTSVASSLVASSPTLIASTPVASSLVASSPTLIASTPDASSPTLPVPSFSATKTTHTPSTSVHLNCTTPSRKKKGPTKRISRPTDSEPAVDEENFKILNELEEDGSSNTCTTQLVSKHALLIDSILGYSNELASFDKLHAELKRAKTVDKYRQYQDILAVLQVKILKAKSDVTVEVREGILQPAQ